MTGYPWSQGDLLLANDLNAAIAAHISGPFIPLNEMAVPNGVATLGATGIVPAAQLPPTVGTLNYLGGWNASTNVPVLASGASAGGVRQSSGNYYLVTVAGTSSPPIDGITTWSAGDFAVSNGSVWQRSQNTSYSGGTVTGPLIYTATGGTTPRAAQDRAADVANVLDFGADPTGLADSAPAINAALAVRRNGRPVDVFAPAGTYLLNGPITVGDTTYAQRLFGDGWSTVLSVGPTFSSIANGVIIIASGNQTLAQASVCDLQILFQQPPDITTTTTASTAAGGMTLTLAGVAGIQVGYYCRDMSHPNSLPFQSTMPQVVSIAGNVVTLSHAAVATVSSGDTMQFAANRSQTVTLSSSPTLAPGAPAIQYPWAIYAVAQSVYFDHVLVGGAWNGIYIRGQTFVIGQYFVGCLNIGLDIDQCFNFNKIDHFQLWGFGFPNASAAMLGIYYDGNTIAANIGRCDDFTCDIFQSWCGILNITSAFSWGQINQLKLDGSNSNLNILGGSWLQIGNMYSTGGQDGIGVPVVCSGACKVMIGTLIMSLAQNNPSITLAGGSLTISSGYMWDGVLGSNFMISVTGGDLSINQMRFDSSAVRTVPYLNQTGGSVRVSNSAFIIAPGSGALAFALTDAVLNSITDVELNGWAFTVPGSLGRYEVRRTNEVDFTNNSSVFYEQDTPSTSQVVIKPFAGFNAAEGKLRLYGTFPTGTDTGARLSSAIRAGFNSTSWFNPYLNFWLANGTNDVASDANMTRMLALTLGGMALGYDAATLTPVFSMNASGTASKRIQFQTASVPRFDLVSGNVDPGDGSNTGSDIAFDRYNDAGVLIDKPLTITRSNGITAITNLAIGANTGPTVRSGTGAATGTQPKGSLWLRTDGAVGSTIYVSQGGGTWNAVAGV